MKLYFAMFPAFNWDFDETNMRPVKTLRGFEPGGNRHTPIVAYHTPGRAMQYQGGKDNFKPGNDGGRHILEIDLDDALQVTDDLTEQYAHAERMMLKYTERCEELKRRMNEEKR